MDDLLDRIMEIWLHLPDDDETAARAIRECYTDPVTVNGTPLSAGDLVARARTMHRAFTGLDRTVVRRIDSPGSITAVFFLHGRHTGPLRTPLGEVAPSGREVRIRTVDVLTVADGKVTEVWVNSDELGMLLGLDALALVNGRGHPSAGAADLRSPVGPDQ